MVDVSILVACLGDYRSIVEAINNCKTKYSYEIWVSSEKIYPMPFHYSKLSKQGVYGGKINFLPDPGTSVKAYNLMFKKSVGKYIILIGGSVIPRSNMFEIIDDLKRQERRGDKLIISALSDDNGSRSYVPVWATMLSGLHGRPMILKWPCFSRKTIMEHLDGVVFNQHFKHRYVDNWLGTYCALVGEAKRQSQSCRIITKPHKSMRAHAQHDLKIYVGLCKLFKDKKSYNFNPRENIDED